LRILSNAGSYKLMLVNASSYGVNASKCWTL
jgi:hypothetical protein